MLGIRQTLTGLFLLLGLGLCLSVALQTWAVVRQHRGAQELTASNLAREQVTRAGMALAQERTGAYLSLLGSPEAAEGPARPRQATDQAIGVAAASLARVDGGGSGPVLDELAYALGDLRARIDGTRGTSERAQAASEVLSGYTALMGELVSLRSALRAQERLADADTTAAFQQRRYATILLDSLSLNEALVAGLLTELPPDEERAAVEAIGRNAERAQLASELLADRAASMDRPVRLRLAALAVAYGERYRPVEQDLLAALAAGLGEDGVRSEAYRLLWSIREITRMGGELQESLFTSSRDRLAGHQRHAALLAALWVSILLLGVAVVARGAWVVRHQVIQPLRQLRDSMIALAGGDLKAPLPDRSRPDEIGAMADALRVFKANAIRRGRLQEERHALHEQLEIAHQQLRKDLEAASAVQLSLLPAPARMGGVRFVGRLRPSHFISGDTYDVLRQPNGPVHFFLADVAGHGAAAALVSVASRSAAAQAILQRRAGDSLAGVMAALNDDWPAHLPYFTVIMGELRPEDGQGRLVQAGHPPPALLRRSGSVEMLGCGGLPIGVIRQATFEEIAFGFGPGDRLLVYSDGLSEAEDPEGRPFTEQRLLDLLQDHLHLPTEALLGVVGRTVQAWRGSDKMEDDMTLLVLEGSDGAEQGAEEDGTWRVAAE